jgi:hypothetical protein
MKRRKASGMNLCRVRRRISPIARLRSAKRFWGAWTDRTIADRECDIAEVFGKTREHDVDFIVRANQPRALMAEKITIHGRACHQVQHMAFLMCR